MKIPKINIPAVNPYRANDLKTEKVTQKPQHQSDKLEISSEAKTLSEVSTFTTERNEHVQAIKAQVDAGTYKVNPEQLAQKLLSYYNK